MTTQTARLPRRRYGMEHPIRRMLLPDGMKLPKAVKQVNDRARRLLDEFDQTGEPLGELERAVKTAAPQDRQAAEARLAEARVRREQANSDAVDALFDLRDAIAAHRDELEAACRDAISEQVARVADALAEIPTAVDMLRREQALLEAVGRAAAGGYLDSLDFRVPGLGWSDRRREKVERIERDRPSSPGDSRHNVPRELDHLLAAVAVAIAEEAGAELRPDPVRSKVKEGGDGMSLLEDLFRSRFGAA
jgi:hypothetical protein